MKNITISDIIKIRLEFVLNNDIFDKEEYKNINEGEIRAFREMLDDIEKCSVDEFVEKYVKIAKKISNDIENNKCSKNIESMVGYNNCIIFTLSLINPLFEYKI